jgi:hypothetical protein
MIRAELKLRDKIQALLEMIDSLEKTINEQIRRLDVPDSNKNET